MDGELFYLEPVVQLDSGGGFIATRGLQYTVWHFQPNSVHDSPLMKS